MKPLIPTQYIINHLIDHGCSRWKQHGFDRMYLTDYVIHKLLGIQVDNYTTGSILINGVEVPTSEGRRILSELNTKFFFDITTSSFGSKDLSSYADEIFNLLTNELITQYEKEHPNATLPAQYILAPTLPESTTSTGNTVTMDELNAALGL